MLIETLRRSVGVALVLGALSAGEAWAGTPPEVLEPYNAYRAALEAQDADAARLQARKALDASLEILGEDDALTGVLAHNLAGLEPDPKLRIDLYRTAIAASPTATREEQMAVAERWVLLSQAHMSQSSGRRLDFQRARNAIDDGWRFISKHGLETTTFGGEIMVAKGWAAAGQGRERRALEWYDRADAVFAGPDHTMFSVLEYSNKLLRGKTLLAFDRDIEAALSLQDVMQNSEGKLPADHAYITEAFQSWLLARSRIEQSGSAAEAERAGVCKCWPYDEMSANAPVPRMRVPPVMPRSAKRSGQVMLKFNVSESGTPEDVTVIGYTDRKFVKPSLRSVAEWQYDVSDDLSSEDRKGITTNITFRLADQSGNIIEADPMVMVADEPL